MFFSADMPLDVVERYHAAFVDNASPVSMVDLRAARQEFPLVPPNGPPRVMVVGALRDTIVDVEGVHETAEAFGTKAVLYDMAHDMMLDVGFEEVADDVARFVQQL